jgi:hypothetical protein
MTMWRRMMLRRMMLKRLCRCLIFGRRVVFGGFSYGGVNAAVLHMLF